MTDAVVPPTGDGYVTCIRKKSGFMVLHHTTLCGRRPGVDFMQYVWHGETPPQPDAHHAVCRSCWKAGCLPGDEKGEGTSEATEDESGDSSSSEGPSDSGRRSPGPDSRGSGVARC